MQVNHKMSLSIELPIRNFKLSPVMLPDRCIHCGAAVATEQKLTIERAVRENNGAVHRLTTTLRVPLCNACNKLDQRNFLISLGAFLLPAILAGLGSFLPVYKLAIRFLDFLGNPTQVSTQSIPYDLLIAGSGALLVGLVVGILLEIISKPILVAFLGETFHRQPLLSLQFFNSESSTIGLKGKISPDGKILRLDFHNPQIAAEAQDLSLQAIEELNHSPLKPNRSQKRN
jgi:hypothetical protein